MERVHFSAQAVIGNRNFLLLTLERLGSSVTITRIHTSWIILANYRWSKIEPANALTRDSLKNQRVAGHVFLVLPWGLFALFLIYVLFGGLYFSPCVTADWVSAECERSVWIPASLTVSNSVWLAVWARDQGTYMRSERRDFFYRILEKKAQHYSNAINSKLQGK